MKLPQIGSDPMDVYSSPVSQIKTKLAIIFEIKPRQAPEKPGRSLSVVWDKRIPLIKGFENNYDYIISFEKLGEKAGNHYHYSKQEFFIPIIGEFKIILEDTKTKVREEIFLSSSGRQILYVPPEIAHVVIAESEICSLLVLATFPNNQSDEEKYQLD